MIPTILLKSIKTVLNNFCKEGIFFGQKIVCKFDIDTLNVNYILEHSLFYDNEDMDSAFVGIRQGLS